MSFFLYNKVIILQSLEQQELQTGTLLSDRLNKFAEENQINFTSEVRNIHSLDKWNGVWEYINDIVTIEKSSPIIHIEMHGDKEYVGIDRGKNGVIPYKDLYDEIRKINIASKNNTFVSMAVCHGMYVSLKMESILDPMPFCGILSSEEELLDEELLDNYTIFYTKLLSGKRLEEAVRIMYEDGSNAEKLRIYTSENIFFDMYKDYLSTYDNDDKIKKRAIQAARDNGMSFDSKSEFDDYVLKFKKQILSTEDESYENARKSFFMFDKYPEIENRFDIPKTLKEFKAFAKNNNPTTINKTYITKNT